MSKQRNIPRQYSLVKIIHKYLKYVDLGDEQKFIFLGEIPNMMGHCIIANYETGKIYSGYHTDYFVELTEDEV